jgi:uncharacterized protein YacL
MLQTIWTQITALILILITVAVFVEAILEAFQPVIVKIKDDAIRTTVNLLVGAVVGILAAWGMGLQLQNYLTILPLVLPPFVSYILIGCAAGAGGSRFWHAVLGFLSNLQLPTVPPVPPAGP